METYTSCWSPLGVEVSVTLSTNEWEISSLPPQTVTLTLIKQGLKQELQGDTGLYLNKYVEHMEIYVNHLYPYKCKELLLSFLFVL